ncbi:acyl carrier protein [Kitasatospora sp. NBC_01287]|uniref:acyl carrier protein n=1 Tax=Kitasatospora sp. NBC_01287 TaxID=2903573 RepID=UPI00225902D3|nr:acyl carrier protein [Kitasatospora sp. NBC_01287]MCX4744406.1 acyl carrier protein [Kitasatospora sp. NBC_01287]
MSALVNPALVQVLVSAFQLPADALRPEATLEELGLDSLAVVELSDILAEEFGVPIVDGELAAAASLDRLGELLAAKAGPLAAEPPAAEPPAAESPAHAVTAESPAAELFAPAAELP